MLTRIPIIALSTLLAACAATVPPAEPLLQPVTPDYLQGNSSRYSLRLDEIDTGAGQSLAKQLPGGLAAGDEVLTFCAALFRVGDAFGLDMVVQNHEDHSINLHRADIVLRDNAGRRLEPILDFENAEFCGLRGRTTARLAQGVVPGTRDSGGVATSRPSTDGFTTLAGSKRIAGLTEARIPASSVERPRLDFVGTMNAEIPNPELPDVVNVPPQKSRVYWSYWSGHQVEYPIFVTVLVNDRHLLLKFAEPDHQGK